MKQYSFKKGLVKGLVSFLSVGGGALVLVPAISEITIAELVTKYLVPLLGSLTVGGVITLVINWLKVKYLTAA